VQWLQCPCVHCGPADAHGQRRCTMYRVAAIVPAFGPLCGECRNYHDFKGWGSTTLEEQEPVQAKMSPRRLSARGIRRSHRAEWS